METKNIINIPEGYEIDKEQSNDRRIVLKKIENRARSWKEYCDMMKGKDSYVVDMYGNVRTTNFSEAPVAGEFEDKEGARVFTAFSMLLKLRKNWVGDWKPDWTKVGYKFTIITQDNNVCRGTNSDIGRSISFPTVEMRDEFFDTFKDLLEEAKTLL